MRFDSVQIGVDDLAAAARMYAVLLGGAPRLVAETVRFQLGRGAVELELGGDAGLHGMSLAADDATRWPTGPGAFHGLDVRAAVAPGPATVPGPAAGVDAIDHVVVHSPNLDRAVALWRDRLGVRLALDRSFPERGLRMLFFRSGGVTLEFVGSLTAAADPNGPDQLAGVAYRVRDLAAERTRLLGAGVEVSAMRAGYKPGSSVATVRSGTAGVPTLLIEPGAA